MFTPLFIRRILCFTFVAMAKTDRRSGSDSEKEIRTSEAKQTDKPANREYYLFYHTHSTFPFLLLLE